MTPTCTSFAGAAHARAHGVAVTRILQTRLLAVVQTTLGHDVVPSTLSVTLPRAGLGVVEVAVRALLAAVMRTVRHHRAVFGALYERRLRPPP